MTDREKAIKDLEDIIATAEGIKGLSDDAGITISLDKIDSLRFGLESLKADASDKTDRGEAIATLTEHLNHWKMLLSEGICCEVEGKETIDALTLAIESIKALDEIVGKIYDLTDTIVVNPENVLQRKTYVKYTDVINIIDYYRKEQE